MGLRPIVGDIVAGTRLGDRGEPDFELAGQACFCETRPQAGLGFDSQTRATIPGSSEPRIVRDERGVGRDGRPGLLE